MIENECEYLGRLVIPSSLYIEIEDKVVGMLQKNNIHTVPIDPFSIARNEGFEMIPFSRLKEKLKEAVKAGEYDGMSFHYSPWETYIICYDDSQSFPRQRFTLLHELGHIYMEHKEESELANKIANHFAAYAIAPNPLIQMYGCHSEEDIREVFNTSYETAHYRAESYKKWLSITKSEPYEGRLLELFDDKEESIGRINNDLMS